MFQTLSCPGEDTLEENCFKLLTSGLNLWTVIKEVPYNIGWLLGLKFVHDNCGTRLVKIVEMKRVYAFRTLGEVLVELFIGTLLDTLVKVHTNDLKNECPDVTFRHANFFESAIYLIVGCLSVLKLTDVVSCHLSRSMAYFRLKLRCMLGKIDKPAFDKLREVFEK